MVLFPVLQNEDLAVGGFLGVLSSSPDTGRQQGDEQTGIRFTSVLVKYPARNQAGYVPHDQRDEQSKRIVPHVGYTVQVKVRGIVHVAGNRKESVKKPRG